MTETKPKQVSMFAPVGSKKDLSDMLDAKRKGIVALVGDARIKRFTSIMLAMTNRHPELLECTMDSVLNAIQHCALIGLMPGPRGDIYLIPFKNKKLEGRKEIVVIHGYKGLMRLGLQHKDVANVEAECVYEDDEFFFDAGERTIVHRYPPDADHDPKKIIGAWSRVWFKGNLRASVLYFNLEQLNAARKKSKQPDGNFWREHPAAMYRKTVIRAHYNGGEIPQTDELSAAMDRELEEEFKDAEVVTVSTEKGGGVAAARRVLGLEEVAIDEDYDGQVDDLTEPMAASTGDDPQPERTQRTLDSDEQFMVQEIHEKLEHLDGEQYEAGLAGILADLGARNLAECNREELANIRRSVQQRIENEGVTDA